MAVEVKSEGKFIGFTGLKYLDDLKEVDLGYRFRREYWGRGFATESSQAALELGFNALQLNRIIAMVMPDNKASVNVLEKLNFKFEKKIIEDDQELFLYALEQ